MAPPPPTAAEEKAFAAEKSAGWVRFLVIVFNTATYYAWYWPDGIPALAIFVSVVANSYGFYVLLAQPYRRFPALTTASFTAITDGCLIILWLAATGGYESPYYLLWYLSLLAVTFRYARNATIIAALAYAVSYVVLLLVLDDLAGHLREVSIRVAFILLEGALGALFAHETLHVFEERFRLQRQVTEAEGLRTLAEAAREALVIHEGEVVREVNQAFCDLTGYTREQLLGKSGMHLAAEESKEVSRRFVTEEPGTPTEGWILRPDGEKRLVRSQSRPIAYQGRPARVTTTVDVTRERAEEEARRAARDREVELRRLKDMDRMKTDFVNAAAHELKTPLTPLKLQVHILQTDAVNDPERRARAIEILDRNLGRLSLLVEDMLDVARLEAGRLEIDRVPLDLRDIVQEAVDTYHDVAQERRVSLAVEAPEPVVVPIDAKRITQILYNLLSNALKFTPKGGRIEVRVSKGKDDALVEVIDNGRGFTPEAGAALFQPFAQPENPVKHEGTGLGLYVSRGIAERHGGTLEAESAGPGRGSRFWLMLPVHPER